MVLESPPPLRTVSDEPMPTRSTHGKPARKPSAPVALNGGAVIDFILTHGGRTAETAPREKKAPAKSRSAGTPRPLRFIDLFCGIGGFRLAFERAGARCVFSSDWDKFSRQTYAANFGEEPSGDIAKIAVEDIPKFDILCGGFPCQPFSLAGVSKKTSLGKKHGFEDERQGNLFFSIAA
jgi:hypothetical protein